MMDLRQLHHFATLAGSGSLHGAARRLNLKQPALSQSIRALESEVGARLVERSPTGTRLTQAGAAFLNEVRLILHALDRAVQVAKLAATATAPLRLGLTPDVISRRLVAILQEFRQNIPEGSVIVSDGSATYLLSLLDAGLLDLALLPTSTSVSHGNGMETLWREDLHLALPAAHPLATEGIIDLHRLDKEAIMAGTAQEDAAVQALLEGCRTIGVTPRILTAAQHREVRLALVAAGAGLTALPASSPVLAAECSIVRRSLSPPLRMTIVAAWPKSGLTPAAQRFLNIARSPTGSETADATAG